VDLVQRKQRRAMSEIGSRKSLVVSRKSEENEIPLPPLSKGEKITPYIITS